MAEFVRTGVFATKAETREISELAATARVTPAIALSSVHALERGGFAGDAWLAVQQRVYEYALVHDLPEVVGFYGFDASNAEFLAVAS